MEATEPELFWMARWVKSQPHAYGTELLTRLHLKISESQMDRPDSIPRRSACVFLVDNLCSAYDVRPAACRRAHSLSTTRCAEQADHIPQNLALVLEAEAMMTGTAHGYRDVGLPASPMELTAGMLAALGDATSEQLWFAQSGKF